MKDHKLIIENIIKQVISEMAYPTSFNMEEFKQLKSFAQRVKYCDQRLEKLGSGSSRIGYKIDDEKVLKLAKNAKGVAQNEAESNSYLQREYTIVAKVFDSDPNDLYIEMELVEKLTKSKFKQIVGFDFDSIWPYLESRFGGRNSQRYTGADKEILDENEWMYELGDMVGSYDFSYGDFRRLSSFGIVNRDGQPQVVLIDFGLTNDVFDQFYKKK